MVCICPFCAHFQRKSSGNSPFTNPYSVTLNSNPDKPESKLDCPAQDFMVCICSFCAHLRRKSSGNSPFTNPYSVTFNFNPEKPEPKSDCPAQDFMVCICPFCAHLRRKSSGNSPSAFHAGESSRLHGVLLCILIAEIIQIEILQIGHCLPCPGHGKGIGDDAQHGFLPLGP